MKPFLIGIAGRSGAGKTKIARQLAAWLPGKTEVVSLDSYYHGWITCHLPSGKVMNFDHPDSLDWPLIVEHVTALSRGSTSRSTCLPLTRRATEKRSVIPSRHLILEGLFTLHSAEVLALLDANMPLSEPVAIVKAFLQPPAMSRPVVVKAVESVGAVLHGADGVRVSWGRGG